MLNVFFITETNECQVVVSTEQRNRKKRRLSGDFHSAGARCEDTKSFRSQNITIDIKIINTPLSVFH